MPEKTGTYKALGSATYSVGVGAAVNLLNDNPASGVDPSTLLSGGQPVRACWITPRGGAIRYYLASGATLSTTAGHPLSADQTFLLTSDLTTFTMISQAGTITVDVDFLGD